MILTLEEFTPLITALGPFTKAPRLAVAVSGGPDSLCLALLLKQWLQAQEGGVLFAVTVDHGLRPESAQEAQQVAAWLEKYNIPHQILRWEDPKPSSRIQEAARKARYALLEHWCKEQEVTDLCLAHHADDQAETVLFRLCRGSGLDGLAGMNSIVHRPFGRWLRPLLTIPKARLKATLEHYNQPWIQDPSNQQETYTRPRLRNLLKLLEQEGLSPQRLVKTAQKLHYSRKTLEHFTQGFLIQQGKLSDLGYFRLSPQALQEAPYDLALRALSQILRTVGHRIYPPRHKTLEMLYERLQDFQTFRNITAGGCYITRDQDNYLFLRELKAIQEKYFFTKTLNTIWDHRFEIRVEIHDKEPLYLEKLGSRGWSLLKEENIPCFTLLKPPQIYYSLPALWQKDDLLAVPSLGYYKHPRSIEKSNIKTWTFKKDFTFT